MTNVHHRAVKRDDVQKYKNRVGVSLLDCSAMIHVQKGVYTVNEKMTELKTFYKLVKYMWKKLVTVCGERILAFA